MGKHPDLDNLNELFEKGENFQLSDKVYEEKTGVALPKGNSYIKHRSALAKKAKEFGFKIADICEEPVIVRTVYLKKK